MTREDRKYHKIVSVSSVWHACDSLFSTLEEIDHSKMEKEAEANGDLGQEVNGGVGGDIVQSEFVEKREGRKVIILFFGKWYLVYPEDYLVTSFL